MESVTRFVQGAFERLFGPGDYPAPATTPSHLLFAAWITFGLLLPAYLNRYRPTRFEQWVAASKASRKREASGGRLPPLPPLPPSARPWTTDLVQRPSWGRRSEAQHPYGAGAGLLHGANGTLGGTRSNAAHLTTDFAPGVERAAGGDSGQPPEISADLLRGPDGATHRADRSRTDLRAHLLNATDRRHHRLGDGVHEADGQGLGTLERRADRVGNLVIGRNAGRVRELAGWTSGHCRGLLGRV
jgi:hypothetical protein